MNNYRLYRLDRLGKFRDWMPIEATSDEEALKIAHGLEREFDCELWRGEKYLGRITKRPLQPSRIDPA